MTTATQWLNEIWESDLPSSSKYIACYIRKFLHDGKKTCWPSKARMVAETGCTKITIKRHLDNLVKGGWLVIDQSNGGRNNRYTIQQGKNNTHAEIQTGIIQYPNGCNLIPANGCDLIPLKSNIKSKEKTINKIYKSTRKIPMAEMLMDRSWSE